MEYEREETSFLLSHRAALQRFLDETSEEEVITRGDLTSHIEELDVEINKRSKETYC